MRAGIPRSTHEGGRATRPPGRGPGPWAARLALYLAFAVVLTWPLVTGLGTLLPGYPNVDASDTVMLRGLVAELLTHPWDAPHTLGFHYPVGYPVLHLVPNLLDHLTAAPLVWLLPFPLSDDAWWLGVLVVNGALAHRLGVRVGGSEGAGYLAGLAWMSCEPLAREVNLHHAPQAMIFWAPLFLHALLDLRDDPTPRRAALAGTWLAFAALSYWYMGLFLGLAALPLLWGLPWRRVALMGAVTALLCLPFLWPHLAGWGELPLTSGGPAPGPAQAPESFSVLDRDEVFVAQHGNDLLFWLRRVPLDTANRVSLLLLAAALWGGRRWYRRPRLALWSIAALGSVMLLGTWLRWGQDLVVVGGNGIPLPFGLLRRLHPVIERLDWPERWGLLVPLGLVPLAARAPRPGWWALAIALENLVVSGNLPAETTSVAHQRCWAGLARTSGAVLELPLKRGGLMASKVGVHQRFHHRPLVNPVLLPPGASAPPEWQAWVDTQPLMAYLKSFEDGRWPADPGADAVRDLRAAGVTVIVLDVEPGGILTPGGIARYRAGLGRHLGPPVDLGCALVWWLDTERPPPEDLGQEGGDAWRTAAAAWKEAHRAPVLDTLIQPTWNAIQRQQ